MLSGPYVVINQLIKYIGKVAHLDIFLTYMLRGEYQSNKKITKIRSYKNNVLESSHSKIHNYILVKYSYSS